MDTASLKEFLALVETQNFWEASELLFMNESTLSKHIKKPEKELQVSLFDRNTRKVSLTPFGKCLIPYARSIVETEKNFLEDLEKENSGAVQPARPRCHPLYGAVPNHGYFSRFPKKTPKPDRHPGSRGRHHLSDRSPDPRSLFHGVSARQRSASA